ncbi:MAG: cobalamin biosynthesis protein [Rhizobiaceae bacterium]
MDQSELGVALDQPPEGWTLANPENLERVLSEICSGEEVRLQGRYVNAATWLMESNLPIDDDGECVFSISETEREALPLELIYNPKRHVVGIGCEQGAEVGEVLHCMDEVLKRSGIARGAISAVASIDVKSQEPAIHAAAGVLQVPVLFFSAEVLEEETPRIANPSDKIFTYLGCHGVAENAALAAAGPDSELVVEKQKSNRTTVAIAKASEIVNLNHAGRR